MPAISIPGKPCCSRCYWAVIVVEVAHDSRAHLCETRFLTPLLVKGSLSGVAGGIAGSLLQIATNNGISLESIAVSVVGGACVFLFGMFIRQGNRLAALDASTARKDEVAKLEAYALRNREEIVRLDGDSRTIDRRIQDSRHMLKNEITPVIAMLENRLAERLDKLEGMLTTVMERRGTAR